MTLSRFISPTYALKKIHDMVVESRLSYLQLLYSYVPLPATLLPSGLFIFCVSHFICVSRFNSPLAKAALIQLTDRKRKQSVKRPYVQLTKLGTLTAIAILTMLSLVPLSAQANILDPLIAPIKRVFKSQPVNDSQVINVTYSGQDLFSEQGDIDTTLESDPVFDDSDAGSVAPANQPSLSKVMQAEFAISRGDIDRGLQIYKREALKQYATPVFERALNLSLLYEPVYDSLTFARVWQQHNPDHLPALFYVAHLSLKALQYELAGEAISQILANDSQADVSEILSGIYPDSTEDRQALLTTLESLPEHNNPALLVMQAGLMAQLDQPEVALVSVSKALSTQPDNIPFIILKADIINQLQPPEDVLAYIRQERQRLPTVKELYLYEIRFLIGLGQTRVAWTLLLEANNLFQDPEITLLAALISIDLEEFKTADALLSDLASSSQYVDQAYYYLGISAERQHNYEKAERFLSKVTQEELILKAKQKQIAIFLMLEQPDKALEILKAFSQQFDVYAPDSAVMQADILRQQGKLAEAQQLLATVNDQFPDDAKLLFARARLLNNQEDTVLKKQLLDHLIFLDPQNPDYQIAMAIVLFETNKPTEIIESLSIARSILNIPFDSPMFKQTNYIQAINLLAAEALSNKQYQQVVDYLETVYEVSPSLDSGIILLRAYQGLGQDDKVTALFEDIQNRFALQDRALNDHLQSY